MNTQFFFKRLRLMVANIAWARLFVAAIGLAVIISTVGLMYWTYRSYTNYQERMAQKVFTEVIEAFNAATKSEKKQEWDSVLALLNDGYEQYKRTAIAPYFLSYKVEVLLNQGKKEEALSVLNTMMKQLSKESLMANLFGVKHALLLMDMGDQALTDQGIQELKELAENKGNWLRDMAQYYLGDYYWSHNDRDQARMAWQQLIEGQWGEPQAISPWSRIAQETLRQIS